MECECSRERLPDKVCSYSAVIGTSSPAKGDNKHASTQRKTKMMVFLVFFILNFFCFIEKYDYEWKGENKYVKRKNLYFQTLKDVLG